MAAAAQRGEATLPRPLLTIGVPVAGVLLVTLFLIQGFRYDLLGERIAAAIEQSQGIRVSIGDLGPAFQLAGPALEGTNIRATLSEGLSLEIDRALVRPAWSLSWFSGNPAVHLELDSALGQASGTASWGSSPSWDGSLSNIDLQSELFAQLFPAGKLAGTLDADIDVLRNESGPEGHVDFQVREGSITSPKLPLALPFQLVDGELTLGGDDQLRIDSLEFDGPVVSGSGSGSIAKGAPFPDRRPGARVAPLGVLR